MPRPKLERPNFRTRRAANGRWYIDWTDPDTGKPKSLSARTADEGDADRQRQELEAGWSRSEPPKEKTVAAILDGYLADRKGHVADYDRLKYAAQAIKRHVGQLRPSMLTPRHYMQKRAAEEVGPGTIRKEVVTLRSALRWAIKHEWLERAPAVDAPSKPADRERFLSRDEATALLQACRTPHLRLFVLLALHTAARKGAILELEWEQVDLAAKLIHLRRPGRAQTKKRRATVPINSVLLAALQEARLARVSDRVIEYRGEPVASIRHAFERAVERAGISHCTRHDLRRTAASWMVMAGVPLKKVAAMLGDTEAMVERVYGRWAPDYLSEAADALAGDNIFVTKKRKVVEE